MRIKLTKTVNAYMYDLCINIKEWYDLSLLLTVRSTVSDCQCASCTHCNMRTLVTISKVL